MNRAECPHNNPRKKLAVGDYTELNSCLVSHRDLYMKSVPACLRCFECHTFIPYEEYSKFLDESKNEQRVPKGIQT